MFSFSPSPALGKSTTILTENNISFDPPVYEQRYATTIRILEDQRWKLSIKKVAEFGCAEMRFFQLLRRIESIDQILQIDIDDELLTKYYARTNPLISDYLRQRENPLDVKVLHGSIGDFSEDLKNTDAVVGIELIEHVDADVLAKIPGNIFGLVQPKIAIFSTPNADFNKIFKQLNSLLANGFRHLDHKFEWTRKEFESWCLTIKENYPNYVVSFCGVGDPPNNYETLGHVSQMAIFIRKDIIDLPLVNPLLDLNGLASSEVKLFKVIHHVEFPYHIETRTKEEIIWAEVECEIYNFKKRADNIDYDTETYKIPVHNLIYRTENLGGNDTIIRKLCIEKGLQIENDNVLVYSDQESDYSDNLSSQSDNALGENDAPADTEENWDT